MVSCVASQPINAKPLPAAPARRIGVLGGTFDPVHIGHLRAAIEVGELLALDEVRLVPCAQPAHRAGPLASAEQRLAMVERAVAGIRLLRADDRELRRSGPTYTYDTLLSLRQELAAQDQLFWLLGTDAFAGLPQWHRWQELLLHCHLLVLQRPDQAFVPCARLQALCEAKQVPWQQLQGPSGQIAFIEQTPLPVSATKIRQRLEQGRSVDFLVPQPVLAYIHTQALYAASF
jgi:nicotinate-nucleotide adenylyltransferase